MLDLSSPSDSTLQSSICSQNTIMKDLSMVKQKGTFIAFLSRQINFFTLAFYIFLLPSFDALQLSANSTGPFWI